jgi:hypothetical protein
MTKENQAAIQFAKDKLRCVISQLEKDTGIQAALPISMKCLEAMQTCDDLMYNADPLPVVLDRICGSSCESDEVPREDPLAFWRGLPLGVLLGVALWVAAWAIEHYWLRWI